MPGYRRRACASICGLKSSPVTCAPRCAAAAAMCPGPQARSSTRTPAATPAVFSSAGTDWLFTPTMASKYTGADVFQPSSSNCRNAAWSDVSSFDMGIAVSVGARVEFLPGWTRRMPTPPLTRTVRGTAGYGCACAALRGPSQLVGVDVSDLHSDGGAARI